MAAPPYATRSQRAGRILFLAYCAMVLAFLIAPVLAIIPLSFNAGIFLHYPLEGLSLRWYRDFLGSEMWLGSIRNSLIVGVSATAIATTLGTLAALGLAFARIPFRGLIMALIISPLVVPVIIVAVGVYFFFAPLGLTSTYTGLILAHAALGAPFVVITVAATLEGFDRNLIRAGQSLGASPVTVFFRIVLPLILPGVVSGALFAFATSLDEVVVALFVAGPAQRTLPRQMFSGIRENLDPTIAAVATFMMLISVILLVAVELLRRRSERLRGLR